MRDARLENRITILTDPTARGIGGPAERAVAGSAQAAQFAKQERVDIAPWHDVIRNGCRRHSAVFQANPAQWFTTELGATKAQPSWLFVERVRECHTKRALNSVLKQEVAACTISPARTLRQPKRPLDRADGGLDRAL